MQNNVQVPLLFLLLIHITGHNPHQYVCKANTRNPIHTIMGNNQGIWKRYTDWTERSRNVISTPCHCMIADLRPKSAGQYHTTHSGSKQNKTSVLLARGHQTLFPLLRYGLIHERWNVRAFLELPTGGLEWEENSNQMVTEAHYYITTVQYYSTVRQNRPTLDFNWISK